MNAVDYREGTALITGASSGIGLQFARQLAQRGSNLILVARRLERLEALASDLNANFGVRATSIALDLGVPGAGDRLATEVAQRGLSVTSLVNNAGFGTHGPFHEEDPVQLVKEINVNVASLVDVSRTFIGELRDNGAGVLINVASMAAYQPNPTMAVYGATKAFVLSFTEALWQESLGTGLRVIALSPGATETEFFAIAGESADGGTRRQSPDEVVKVALHALDRRNPPPSVISGRMNHAVTVAARLVSRRRVALMMGSLMDR